MAMGLKNISNILFAVNDPHHWHSTLALSEHKLVVVDIHLGWCGNCEAILPTMSRLLIDYEKCEERFAYCTADRSKFELLIQESFPTEFGINLKQIGCVPMFAVYKDQACVAVVQGVDTPTLLSHIAIHMPKIKENDQ
jgi:thiol-disulfide isomerase/thioredoxin